jgi:hypothetical protein
MIWAARKSIWFSKMVLVRDRTFRAETLCTETQGPSTSLGMTEFGGLLGSAWVDAFIFVPVGG